MAQKRGSYPPGKPEGGGSALPTSRLIGLHRHSLTNVLIVGGSSALREEVARAFHRESPLAEGSFVQMDCASEEEALRTALRWWTAVPEEPSPNPCPQAEHGTLYLDPVEELSPDTQYMLLGLARRLQGEPGSGRPRASAGRLVAGNPRDLGVVVAEGGFLPALHDALDKVRVELGPGAGEVSA